MNPNFRCGDPEALVAYLYEECEPDDREAIAGHLAGCAACAEEVEALRSTRALLADWAPPVPAPGFQISAPGRADAVVLRPAAWWRQPLPAWAQAAAAVLIFAAGMAAGMGRATATPPAVATTSAPVTQSTAPATTVVAPAVTREDLARLERRLAAAEAAAARPRPAVSTLAAANAASADEDALVRRLETLIDARLADSEARQQSQNALMIADVVRNFEMQERQVRALGQVHEVTARELRQHRDALDSLMPLVRVSFAQPTATAR